MAERLFEAGPVPIAFVAVTVKLYMVPFVRPLTVQFRLTLTQEAPPGEAVALKLVIGEPPLLAGAAQVRATAPLPAVAPLRVGAPGTVAVGGVLVLVAVGGAGVFVLVAVGGTGVFVAVPGTEVLVAVAVGGTGVLVAVDVPVATVRVSTPEDTLRLPASSIATAVMLYVPAASAVVVTNQ
jgi:hypothetical protein